MAYDAFISYSHGGEKELATNLQETIKGIARPWWRRRSFEVFRDDTGLGVEPGLWPSIERALDDARWLIVLASPDSAASMWVGREIEHWLERKGPESLLVVMANGDDSVTHPALDGVALRPDQVVDLRPYLVNQAVARNDQAFRGAVAPIAAKLADTTTEQILATDAGMRRRTRIGIGLTALVVTGLVIAGSVALSLGLRSQEEATVFTEEVQVQQAETRSQANVELAEDLAIASAAVAESRGDLSLLLAAHSATLNPGADQSLVLGELLANDVVRYLHGGDGGYVALDMAWDAPRVAAVDRHGTALAWDSDTGQLLFSVPGDAGDVAWDAQGRVLMVADRKDTVRFFGPEGEPLGEPVQTGHLSYRLQIDGGGPQTMTRCERAADQIPSNCQATGEVQTHADLHPDGSLFFVYDAKSDELVAYQRTDGTMLGSWPFPDGLDRFDDQTGELLLRDVAIDLSDGTESPIRPPDEIECSQAGLLRGPQVFSPSDQLWIMEGKIFLSYDPVHGDERRPMADCNSLLGPGGSVGVGAGPEFWEYRNDGLDISSLRLLAVHQEGSFAAASEFPPVLIMKRGVTEVRDSLTDLVSEACSVANRNLTADEVDRYFAGTDPVLVCSGADGTPREGGLPVASTGPGSTAAIDTYPIAARWPSFFEIELIMGEQAGIAYLGPCGSEVRSETSVLSQNLYAPGGQPDRRWCSQALAASQDSAWLAMWPEDGSAPFCVRLVTEPFDSYLGVEIDWSIGDQNRSSGDSAEPCRPTEVERG